MKYLLDTHTALWALGDKKKLSEIVARVIIDPANEKYVSMASAWELAIKIRLEKITFNGGVERFFHKIDDSDIRLLPIKREHVKILETLPLLHRDPFDRILVASATSEDMCLITADENIHKYDVPWIW